MEAAGNPGIILARVPMMETFQTSRKYYARQPKNVRVDTYAQSLAILIGLV
jgi:hypothetical protein